jgi:Uma2 family endonuclease
MGSPVLSPDPFMSVEEYLHTSFDGADREYLDGEVVERNMGNTSHGRVQCTVAYLFRLQEERTGLYAVVEVRQRVTASRFRIPDVAVFVGRPAEEVPASPPLVAIEVLSPDDRASYLIPKLAEYRRWGVPNIWVIDPDGPDGRKLFVYDNAGLREVEQLELPDYGITFSSDQIFS